jgi:hypothetical protein
MLCNEIAKVSARSAESRIGYFNLGTDPATHFESLYPGAAAYRNLKQSRTTKKTILRKPDDRAPVGTSTLPNSLNPQSEQTQFTVDELVSRIKGTSNQWHILFNTHVVMQTLHNESLRGPFLKVHIFCIARRHTVLGITPITVMCILPNFKSERKPQSLTKTKKHPKFHCY